MAMIDPAMESADLSPEEQKKKKLQQIAQQQMEAQNNNEPEEGIHEQSMTEIPGRAAMIGKLKSEMPIVGEAADMLVPSDLEDVVPGMGMVMGMGKKAMHAAEEMSPDRLRKLKQLLLRSEGSSAVEKLGKDEAVQAAKYAEKISDPAKKAEKFIADKEIGIVKSNPKAGADLNYKEMNAVNKKPEGPGLDYSQMKSERKPDSPDLDYSNMKVPGADQPKWKSKQISKVRRTGFQ